MPVRVIENVEAFKPELEQVAFIVRHAEFLVYLEVETDDSRTQNRIAADIAELSVV